MALLRVAQLDQCAHANSNYLVSFCICVRMCRHIGGQYQLVACRQLVGVLLVVYSHPMLVVSEVQVRAACEWRTLLWLQWLQRGCPTLAHAEARSAVPCTALHCSAVQCRPHSALL